MAATIMGFKVNLHVVNGNDVISYIIALAVSPNFEGMSSSKLHEPSLLFPSLLLHLDEYFFGT